MGGLLEEDARALEIAAALVVTRDDEHVVRGFPFEPLRGEAMTEGAIFLREHRVGGFPHERVAKLVARARCASPSTTVESREVLLRGQAGEDLRERRRVTADQRVNARERGLFTEDGRRPQDLPRLRIEIVETRFDHRDDGIGELCATLRDRADELLEEERVALRALDDQLNLRGLAFGPRTRLTSSEAARRESSRRRNLLSAAIDEEARIRLRDLGAREAEQEERGACRRAKRAVEETQARGVGPVTVLDYDDERPARALRAKELFEREPHADREVLRIEPCGPELDALAVGKRNMTDLAEELGRAVRMRNGRRIEVRDRLDTTHDPPLSASERIRRLDPERAPQELAEERGGDACATGSAKAAHTHESSRSRTRRKNSSRRRVLPTPGFAVTTTARATDSTQHSSSIASRVAISRARPTNGVGLPSSVRGLEPPALRGANG